MHLPEIEMIVEVISHSRKLFIKAELKQSEIRGSQLDILLRHYNSFETFFVYIYIYIYTYSNIYFEIWQYIYGAEISQLRETNQLIFVYSTTCVR